MASLPGRIGEVTCGPPGERWRRHAGDTGFPAAWPRHPEFPPPGRPGTPPGRHPARTLPA
ncbi:DUF6368 family protein [Streptomyces sp. NPDC085946]|uniref:DUF6368 family protein n=1 Tax=Streptomyces sp. NPDC085946 TaxID=3365744 RepID=UPI0037D77455